MDGFPDDMPDEIREMLEQILEELGIEPEVLFGLFEKLGSMGLPGIPIPMPNQDKPAKGNPGDPVVNWDEPVKHKKLIVADDDLMKVFSKARELGLETPDDTPPRLMAYALICTMGMCLPIGLDTVRDTNIINVKGIKLSVSGTGEAKAFGVLLKRMKKKITKEPNGLACMDIAANWILSKE